MRLSRFVFAALAVLMSGASARAELVVEVDKSAQQMTVTQDGAVLYVWPVSTGAPGYDTPSGEFKPFRMEKDHFSREWDDAPMPNSIFFTQQGHAIHGSSHVKAIGTPASHGCVRLEPGNAAILWDLVKHEKMANTRVVLTGETPAVAPAPAVAKREPAKPRVYGNDDYDPDFTGALPPPPKVQRKARWSNYRDERDFYRGQPYYEAPRRFYRYGGSPYPYGW
ncbi:MAG TPA: L,D-transpeptidase [Pseudolabrys sp.]